MPRVSIIIPSFNRADMIMTAIESVLLQVYPDWEAIIVDDGSDDQTREVAAQVKDTRFRYIYQANKGLPGARNTGIRASNGEYVAFLDSDDAFLPEKLSLQVPILDAEPQLGLVAGGYIDVDSNMKTLRELRPWEKNPALDLSDWLRTCPFCVGSPLVRRNWLDKAGLFDETMRFVEDWDLWLRLSSLDCRMRWIKQPVYLYRMHDTNMVRQAVRMKNGMITMFDKFFAQPDLPAEAVALRGEAYGHAYLNAAARALAGGDGKESQVCLNMAFESNPRLLFGQPPEMLATLASFALSPLCNGAGKYMELLAENLPDVLQGWSRQQVLGVLNGVNAFENAGKLNSLGVIRNALAAVVRDPRWLKNRGLVAITGRALFGTLRREPVK
ncbi:MAG TPA: glycosyltransferase [Longilinea sp.]|nr:glycosyltransferase [Longilinea sp.]